VGKNTLIQETILRLDGLDNLLDPIIICNVDHRFLVAEQCQQINTTNPTILLEPVSRNTAPAIAAAALQSLKICDDAILLVLSADHSIQDVRAFHQAIDIAIRQVQSGKLVTFGIVPKDANTGYGYIKSFNDKNDGAYKVENFVEKPDLQTAEKYIEQGNYLWNSGMFMFQASTLIDELTSHSPDIVKSVNNSIVKSIQDLDFIRLDEQAFKSSPSESIDYALMEKSKNIVVVSLDAQWNDVGSWSALYDIGKKDDKGNVVQGDVITKDAVNTYINATNHLVVAIGVQDLVIVDTPNATLISTQDKSQEVKKL
jgi:mannose-1-phosphate guanylyltransferase/mannose-6-phosphate isomerase